MITDKKDIKYKEMAKILKEKHSKWQSCVIILKENIVAPNTIIKNLDKLEPDIEVKSVTVGYLQRGSKPTLIELEYARKFASLAIAYIKKCDNSFALAYKDNGFEIILRNEGGKFLNKKLK